MNEVLRIPYPLDAGQMLKLRDRTLDLLPNDMAETTLADADYHFHTREAWVDLNQMTTQRNVRYHRQVLDWIEAGLGKECVILELGGGVGYDAQTFLERRPNLRAYIFSEISPDLADTFRRKYSNESQVISCAMDASSLRIEDGEIDVLFMIAALHHVPHLEKALAEFDRVVKPGGIIIFGIEPNRFWTGFMQRLKPIYRRIFKRKDHSAGDEEAEGFSRAEFIRIGDTMNWKVVKLVPVWFFCGFLHYGLEAIHRILRLRKRIVVPAALENALIRIDEWLLAHPFFAGAAWHYTVYYRKAAGTT